ncbi:hypothetical protein ACTL6U_19360 [Rhodovibrionaceae bacterium A322]
MTTPQTTKAFPAAQDHGPIEQIFANTYWVQGRYKSAPGVILHRNMVILQEEDGLVLVNPIRLTAEGEAQLEKLGKVRHLVRLGAFHGLDDAYLVERYGADFWCQEHSDYYKAPQVSRVITSDGACPVSDGRFLLFEKTRKPECLLLLAREGGLLLACDSLQNYASFDNVSFLARIVMKLAGFTKGVVIGSFWKKAMTPKDDDLKADYDRILSVDFENFLSAHGHPLLGGAKAAITRKVAEEYS